MDVEYRAGGVVSGGVDVEDRAGGVVSGGLCSSGGVISGGMDVEDRAKRGVVSGGLCSSWQPRDCLSLQITARRLEPPRAPLSTPRRQVQPLSTVTRRCPQPTCPPWLPAIHL